MIIGKIQTSKTIRSYSKQQCQYLSISNTSAIPMKGSIPVPSLFSRLTNSKVEPRLRIMFEQFKGLNGEEFARKAYELTSQYLGYEGISPSLSLRNMQTCKGKYTSDGQISISTKLLGHNKKKEILQTIWHEFTHFIQDSDIYRTKGLREDSKNQDQETKKAIKWFLEVSNLTLYEEVASIKGFIPENSKKAKQTKKFLLALFNYRAPFSGLKETLTPEELWTEIKKWPMDCLSYNLNCGEIEARKITRYIGKQYEMFETTATQSPDRNSIIK